VCKSFSSHLRPARGDRLSAVRIDLPQEKPLKRCSWGWTAGLLVLAIAAAGPAAAKTPGGKHCYKGVCHRVKSITETQALVGKTQRLKASHYGHCRRDRYNPCRLTSSGEKFRAGSPDNAASPDLPDGTILLIYYPVTGRAAVVRVNNAGPYWHGRRLDVSEATAKALGFARKGVAELHVRVLRAPVESETRYRSGRRYRRVPGYIGKYASLDHADRAVRFIASFAARARLAEVNFEDFDEFALEAIPVRNVKRRRPVAEDAPVRLTTRNLAAARPSFVWLNETGPSGVIRLTSSARGARLYETKWLAQLAPSASAQSVSTTFSAGTVSLAAARLLKKHDPREVVAPLRLASLNRELLPQGVKQESLAHPLLLTQLAPDRTMVARSDGNSLYARLMQFANAARKAARSAVSQSRVTKSPPREQGSAWWRQASWNLSFASISKALADAAKEASRKARNSVTRFRVPPPRPRTNDIATRSSTHHASESDVLQASRHDSALRF
jgi:rare lipoprotein A (peptidoglycan hydrolase)